MAEPAPLRRARVDAQRQALRARVVEFRRRLEDDGEELGKERERLIGPDSWVGNHPITTVAGLAVAGFVAGLAPAPSPVAPATAAKKVAGKGASVGLNALRVEAGVILKDIVQGMVGGGGGDDSSA